MGLARLNVWITEIGEPCHIINPRDGEQWYVHIVDCEGKVLEWCGRRFRDIPTKCGHAEVEIPPGCYAVFASHSREGEGVGEFGNRLTHVQIVRANCGDHVCVTLFSPSLWHCGTWFKAALLQHRDALTRAGVNERVVGAAVGAVQDLLGALKPDRFAGNLDDFDRDGPREQPPGKKR